MPTVDESGPSKEEIHRRTIEDVKVGHEIQKFVAGYFAALGVPVRIPELKLREKYSTDPFDDGGDLFMYEKLIEVKSTKYPFTSVETFKFDPMAVDDVASWKVKIKLGEKPVAVIEVCQKTKTMIWIPVAETEEHWTVGSMPRYRFDDQYDCLFCARKHWREIDGFLGWLQDLVARDAPDDGLEKAGWDAETVSNIRWFRSAKLPAEGFALNSGLTVVNPELFRKGLEMDIEQGPRGIRARFGAVQGDLRRLRELFP